MPKVTALEDVVAWKVRTEPHERHFMKLGASDHYGRWGLALAASTLPQDLLEGVKLQPARADLPELVNISTKLRPRMVITPDDPVEVLRLEQRWLHEYQLAASLNREPRLGAMTFVVKRIDLSEYRMRFDVRGDWTHVLGLQEVHIHEVEHS